MKARGLASLSLFVVMMGVFASQVSFAADSATFSYAPKLSLRFNTGMMQNVGTAGGTGGSLWGLNVLAVFYPSSVFALGAGYRSNFDMIKGTTPVSGIFVMARGYFLGQGTRSLTDANRMAMERQENYALYGGLEFGQSNYYLGESARIVTDTLTGSFFNMNALLGADMRLSDHFEINVEGSLGLLILASTDEKYKIKGTLVNLGVSYLW